MTRGNGELGNQAAGRNTEVGRRSSRTAQGGRGTPDAGWGVTRGRRRRQRCRACVRAHAARRRVTHGAPSQAPLARRLQSLLSPPTLGRAWPNGSSATVRQGVGGAGWRQSQAFPLSRDVRETGRRGVEGGSALAERRGLLARPSRHASHARFSPRARRKSPIEPTIELNRRPGGWVGRLEGSRARAASRSISVSDNVAKSAPLLLRSYGGRATAQKGE